IRAVATRGGVVGVMFAPWYLKGRPWGTVDDVVDHLEAVAEAGGPAAAALGSDWDGAVTMPGDLSQPAGLGALAGAIARRGLDVGAVLGANFLALWRRVRP